MNVLTVSKKPNVDIATWASKNSHVDLAQTVHKKWYIRVNILAVKPIIPNTTNDIKLWANKNYIYNRVRAFKIAPR